MNRYQDNGVFEKIILLKNVAACRLVIYGIKKINTYLATVHLFVKPLSNRGQLSELKTAPFGTSETCFSSLLCDYWFNHVF